MTADPSVEAQAMLERAAKAIAEHQGLFGGWETWTEEHKQGYRDLAAEAFEAALLGWRNGIVTYYSAMLDGEQAGPTFTTSILAVSEASDLRRALPDSIVTLATCTGFSVRSDWQEVPE